ARCTKTGVQEVLYSISLPRSATRLGGTTSHPRRQPVMSHALENVLVLMTRSSSSMSSRNDGATPPPKYRRSYASSAKIQMPCRRQCSSSVFCSAREMVQPVGLLGELR